MINQPTPRPNFAKVMLSDDPQYMTVWFSWTTDAGSPELDRPISYGMSCSPRNVPRLIRAFLEGALFADPRIEIDTQGQSYVACRCRVFGKRINRDLIDLGY